MNKNESDQNFLALTGVRAVAAYMVFIHHYTSACAAGNLALSFVKEFYTGVTIFFVLSGFLIYYKYSATVVLEKKFLFNYFKNRFARVYPAYFLVVILTSVNYLVVGSSTIQIEFSQMLLQLTFIRGFSDTLKFIGVGQGWTLTTEETFYFLFPFMILLMKRVSVFAVLLGVYCVGVILLGIGMSITYNGFFASPEFVLYYTFFGRSAEFFAGMYLAKFILKKGLRKSISRIPYITALGLVGTFACVFAMSQFQLQDCSYGLFTVGGSITNNFVMPVFVSILFYGVVSEESVLKNFLGSRVMVFFGKNELCFLSYSCRNIPASYSR